MKKNSKSGYAAIIGLPNVGKSTLINSLVKRKISIISKVPQTTRNIIRGIYTHGETQIVFIDSPGYHRQKYKFNKALNKMIAGIINDVDIVLFMVSSLNKENDELIKLLKGHSDIPALLVINKSDLLKGRTDIIKNNYAHMHEFEGIYSISALRGKGIPQLIDGVVSRIPEGPFYYPADQKTDRDEKFVLAEIVREKLFNYLRQEMPHKVIVVTDSMDYDEMRDMYFIQFIIWVEKDQERGIIIGKNGSFLKNIGIKSRTEIESILKKRVFLSIGVKTKERWRDNSQFFYSTMAYERDILLT